jgi:hypothetical protein
VLRTDRLNRSIRYCLSQSSRTNTLAYTPKCRPNRRVRSCSIDRECSKFSGGIPTIGRSVQRVSLGQSQRSKWLHGSPRIPVEEARYSVDAVAVKLRVPVWIEIRPKRYRCPHREGSPTSTQSTSWYQRRSPNTKAYEQWLLRILVNSTVRDVSHKLNLSEAIVNGVLDRWIETSVNWAKIHQISVLGIDEIALKRGHRDYVVIVTHKTSTGVSILAVLPDRKRETVEQFLASIPPHLQATIERVCSDMYWVHPCGACPVTRSDSDCGPISCGTELSRLCGYRS